MPLLPRLLLFPLLLSLPAQAERTAQEVGMTLELVPEVTSIQPGQPFYVGAYIEHEPEFHTYWKVPGIVGVPTQIQWDLPEGWAGGELEYPEPERVYMYQLKAQGYERDVLLQARITPPADLEPGSEVEIRGKAIWMCCANSCHPGYKDLTLRFPVKNESPAWDDRWRPVFERERQAQVQETEAWSAIARQLSDTEVELRVKAAADIARPLDESLVDELIFFTEDGWIDTDEPHALSLEDDGTLVWRLPISSGYSGPNPPAQLHGILQWDEGWLKDGSARSIRIAPELN